MKTYAAYLRVSTTKQGANGLGIDAQREAIRLYNGAVQKEFVEVESGKRDDRPELAKALAYCKLTGSTLLVAKLDRLSRSVSFIATLMDSGVDFIACDFPEANRLILHVLSAVAEHERTMISVRTKAALAQAKLRGVKLGNPNLTDEARQAGREVSGKRADEFATRVRPMIEALQSSGMSLRGVARELNKNMVKTAQGKEWTPTAVKNLLAR